MHTAIHSAPLSFLSALFLQLTFSEFFWSCNTWQKVRVVNSTHKLALHRWCNTSATELYDLNADPDQLVNLAPERPDEVRLLVRLASHLGNCSGAQCSAHVDPATLPDPGTWCA